MSTSETIAIASLLIIAYHYLGYPLMLWIWCRLRGGSAATPVDDVTTNSPRQAETTFVSFVISAYNEEDVIVEKLRNSMALAYDHSHFEIIVVTDGSNDATVALAREFITQNATDVSIRLLHEDRRAGKSAAINRAVQHARGQIYVFSDANAIYQPDALRQLVARFEDQSIGAVSGQKTVVARGIGESEGLYWRYESAIKTLESTIASTTGVVGEMFAIRSALYREIPHHIINDDAYLGMLVVKNGKRVVYEKSAVCVESPSASLKDELTRRRRINAGRFQLLFDRSLWPQGDWRYVLFYWSHKFLRLFLGPLMLALLVSTTVAVLSGHAGWFTQLLFVVQLIAYLLAFINRIPGVGARSMGLARLTKLCDFVISSNLSTIPALTHYLLGNQSVLWQRAERL